MSERSLFFFPLVFFLRAPEAFRFAVRRPLFVFRALASPFRNPRFGRFFSVRGFQVFRFISRFVVYEPPPPFPGRYDKCPSPFLGDGDLIGEVFPFPRRPPSSLPPNPTRSSLRRHPPSYRFLLEEFLLARAPPTLFDFAIFFFFGGPWAPVWFFFFSHVDSSPHDSGIFSFGSWELFFLATRACASPSPFCQPKVPFFQPRASALGNKNPS